MERKFNTKGICVPEKNYMVDLAERVRLIEREYIEPGEYFVINRARQYGKTTTLRALEKGLLGKYTVIRTSFQGLDASIFADVVRFIKRFVEMCAMRLISQGFSTQFVNEWAIVPDGSDLFILRNKIASLVEESDKLVVLIIDEVDQVSNNDLFLSFLGMLREMYLEDQDAEIERSFHNVILAGVYDIMNLKRKVRGDEEHRLNSPWNIEESFYNVDMSFSAKQIAGMLTEYESDHNIGMDIDVVAECIHFFTGGYPYLVSALCKIIHDNSLSWTADGVQDAEQRLLNSRNKLFDDITKNLTNNKKFAELVQGILLGGQTYTYEDSNPAIDLGVMFGILKNNNGMVALSNVIFQSKIQKYFISIAETDPIMSKYKGNPTRFVRNGKFYLDDALKAFERIMRAEYRHEYGSFIEKTGRLLLLLWIVPSINGEGGWYTEPQIRGNQQMDLVIQYGADKFIIELKIWRGEQYEQEGAAQLAKYLKDTYMKEGYLVSFCDNIKSPRESGVYEYDGVTIHEYIIAYKDNVS